MGDYDRAGLLREGVEFGPRAAADPDLLARVAARFALGPVLAATDIGGTYNLNLRVATAGGEWVVRVHRPWVGADRLALLHQIRHSLGNAGLPVPEPLAAPGGATILPYGDRLVEVEPFVPHDGSANSWERYAVAFAALGPLHDALATRIGRRAFIPPRVSNGGTPDTLLAGIAQTAVRIRRTPGDGARSRALALCAEAHDLLVPVRDWWAEGGRALPAAPTHGDYGGENVLFDHERVVAILDFDFLAIRARVFDLAYALFWALTRLEGRESPERRPWQRARELLARYNAATAQPLTAEESRALPLAMACVPLHWLDEARFLPHPARAVVAQADRVRFARWLCQHRDELAALFT